MSFSGAEHMQASNIKFTGFYPAEVIDDQADPSTSGKVKVRVFPMMKGIDAAALPWAIPAFPLFEAANGDQGFYCVPSVGSRVWVFFTAGEFDSPVYFASAPGATDGPAGRSPGKLIIKTRDEHTITIDSSAILIEHSNGNKVELGSDITVEHNGGQKVVLTSSGIELGTSSFKKLLNEAAATIYNSHTHPVPGVTTGTGATTSSAPTQQMGTTEQTVDTKAS
jgi:hypothetical protein